MRRDRLLAQPRSLYQRIISILPPRHASVACGNRKVMKSRSLAGNMDFCLLCSKIMQTGQFLQIQVVSHDRMGQFPLACAQDLLLKLMLLFVLQMQHCASKNINALNFHVFSYMSHLHVKFVFLVDIDSGNKMII